MSPRRLYPLTRATAVALLVLAAAPAAAAAAAIEQRVIIAFDRAAGPAERRDAREDLDATLLDTIGGVRTQVVAVEGSVEDAAARAERDPSVRWAEPVVVGRAQFTPNDPYFAGQWALHNGAGVHIGAPQAWDLSRGDGVLVGVADTGTAFGHVDAGAFATNTREVAGNRVDDDANGLVDDVRGWDFVNADADPSDDHGHGTAVAGVVNARTDNAVGIAGTAPGARVLHAKVLSSSGSGGSDAIAAGMDYLARQGARIVNVSIGGGRARVYADVIAAHPDTLFVISAGNYAKNNDDPTQATYPCAEPFRTSSASPPPPAARRSRTSPTGARPASIWRPPARRSTACRGAPATSAHGREPASARR